MKTKYKVVIVGAGTAGLTARRQVAKFTDEYLVVDGGALGTTCARVGCMPSKVLIQLANDFHRAKELEKVGVQGVDALSLDSAQAMNYLRKLRDRFVKSTVEGMDSWRDSHFVGEYAEFVDKQTLKIGGKTVEAESIVLATGSSSVVPEAWQKFSDLIFDSEELFELEALPKSCAVIGLGVIGIELGQALHRLGVDVVAISKADAIGGLTDPDLIQYTKKSFSKEMKIDFSGVKQMARKDSQLCIQSEKGEYRVDRALVAVGRKPNLSSLKLEKAGVQLRDDGNPEYDLSTLKLHGANVYIAGDVNNHAPLLHEAADEGFIAGLNAVSGEDQCFSRRTHLSIVFSSPNIAVIGKSYKQLKDSGLHFETGSVCFEGQGRSIVKMQDKGMLHIYADSKTAVILGAELFAPAGEHLAHLIAFMVKKKVTVIEALGFPFYHPVVEEGLRTALRNLGSKIYDENEKSQELSRCDERVTNWS